MSRAGANSVTAANKEKAQKSADLRVAGATWVQIAKEVGYKTEAGARLAVNRHFEREAKATFEVMHPVLQERAEAMWRKAWAKLNRASTREEWDSAFRAGMQVLTYSARINGLLDRQPLVQVNVNNHEDIKTLRDEFKELRANAVTVIEDDEIAVEDDETVITA